MLCLRTQVKFFKTCPRSTPTRGILSSLPRLIRRHVSNQDLDENRLVARLDRAPHPTNGNGEEDRKAESDKPEPLLIRIHLPGGKYMMREVKRSAPNAKSKRFMRDLEALVTYPDGQMQDPRDQGNEDELSKIRVTSLPEDESRERKTRESDFILDPQSQRWFLMRSGHSITRNYHLTKEQYLPLLEAIDKEADLLNHHPHILGYEYEGNFIVNIICTTHRPAGLSRKDLNLAAAINQLTSQLQKPTSPTDHSVLRNIARKIQKLNTHAAKQKTSEVQLASTSATATAPEAGSAVESPVENPSPEAGKQPEQHQPRPTSSNLSFKSTLPSLIISKIDVDRSPIIKKILADYTNIHKDGTDKPSKPPPVKEQVNSVLVRKVNAKKRRVRIHKDRTDAPSKPPPTKEPPSVELVRRLDLNVRRVLIDKDRTDAPSNQPPIQEREVRKLAPSPPQLQIRGVYSGNKITKVYMGEEALTAGDILRGILQAGKTRKRDSSASPYNPFY